MRRFVVDPRARAELVDTVTHYRELDDDTGERFALAGEASLGRIREAPEALSLEETLGPDREIRRVRLKDFPFRLFFLVTPDAVHVLSVEHVARGEPAWRRRLPPSP